ncbi:MAG: hypothetical protein PUE96_01000 [Oscillospiraceae bacterium]|nr:hypothetical protein [Oscillospiraceae bacterium]
MRETSNYKLSQWDKTDRIKMEDFNGDNEKIDAALNGLKALCNCRVYSATYVGTDEIPLVVEVPNRPVAVFVKGTSIWGFGIRGDTRMFGHYLSSNIAQPSVIWDERSVTLGSGQTSSTYAYNITGQTYGILVLMDAES